MLLLLIRRALFTVAVAMVVGSCGSGATSTETLSNENDSGSAPVATAVDTSTTTPPIEVETSTTTVPDATTTKAPTTSTAAPLDQCDALELAIDGLDGFELHPGHPDGYENFSVEGVESAPTTVRQDDIPVAVVEYPGSWPVGDSGDLLQSISSGGYDWAIIPNVFHTPDPWRAVARLSGVEDPCDQLTVRAWGSSTDAAALARIVESLAIG